jgi:hypothetical protein
MSRAAGVGRSVTEEDPTELRPAEATGALGTEERSARGVDVGVGRVGSEAGATAMFRAEAAERVEEGRWVVTLATA